MLRSLPQLCPPDPTVLGTDWFQDHITLSLLNPDRPHSPQQAQAIHQIAMAGENMHLPALLEKEKGS